MARRRVPRIEFARTRSLVRNFPRSWRFYRDVLGLAPVQGHGAPPYGEFRSAGALVSLFERRRMADALALAPGRYSTRSVGQSALIFESPDVDAFARFLRSRRVHIISGPVDRPDWQLRTIHFRDPDGYLIEVYSRPRSAPGS